MFIDFHSHILPAADHGSADLQTSLQQIELAKKAGVDVLIATPHFYPRYESAQAFLQRREETAAELKKALPADAPKLLIGGEIHLCRGLEHMQELDELCVEGTNVLLLELPASFAIREYEQTLDALLYERKLQVVLAHIDRYRSSVVDLLLDLGFMAQINLDAFSSWRRKRQALSWAGSNSVVALGSDLHGLSVGYSQLPKAKKLLGQDFDSIMLRSAQLLELTEK